MKFLLKAAIRTRKHLSLLVATFLSLFCLTTANQLEMFSVGVLTNSGADFFSLFSSDQKSGGVSLKEVEARWDEIDKSHSGKITKYEAADYLANQGGNPLNWLLHKVKGAWDLNESNVHLLVILIISVALFKAIWLFTSRYLTQLLAIRVSRDLRLQYFEHIQFLPMSFYQKYNIGSLSSRVAGDAGQIASSLNSFLLNYLQTPFTIVTTLGACFYISWQLSLVIFFGLPMIVFPVVFLARRVKRVSRQLQTNQERFTSILIDFLAGIQTVKIFAMEQFSFKKYKEHNDKMAHLQSKTAKYDLLSRPILHTIATFCLAAVLLVGLYMFQMTLSQLIVFCGLLHLFYEPVKKFAEENANIQKGVVAAERMFEVLNIKPQIEDLPHAVEIKEFKDHIVFDRVWFRYQDEWVLKDVSFTIEKGQTVAIVGPTGSGKSTIVQLLPRLYEPEQGEIRIDGYPLKHYTQRSIRDLLAFVSQKPFFFLDTVSANIAFGRDFSYEEIEQAARRAHAEEFIVRLPSSYETLLAETAQNLSGGQQQRLAIARALVKKSPILVLDEATSSLDAVSEKRIKAAIMALHGEVTQILIAHRLTTIEHADKIIYLEDGHKLAEGTHSELLKTCPPFKFLWDTYHLQKQKAELFS